MTDDTPRDPLAAQPLTEEEIAGIRKALRSPVGEDSAATGTIRRLLATLDATRPSGGEALRAALLEDMSNLSRFVNSTGEYVDIEDVLDVIVTRLATPSSAPRPTVESLEAAIEGLVPGGPGITFEVDALGVRPRTPSSAPDVEGLRHALELIRDTTLDQPAAVNVPVSDWNYRMLTRAMGLAATALRDSRS